MRYNIAVIGGGPAGISAAVTASSKGRRVILFEAHGFSPRLRSVAKVTDYMGIPDMSGSQLMDTFVNHLRKMDVDIIEEKVVFLKEEEDYFALQTNSGNFEAEAVVLATGISRSDLLTGEREFLGKGVAYCTHGCTENFKGKCVAAIATVPNIMDEVEKLAEVCKHVYFFPCYSGFVPPKNKNITVVLEAPTEITGTTQVTGLRTENDYFNLQGVFMFRASDPLSSFLPELQIKGRSIYVDDQAQTNIEGVFAGGDCTGQPWQCNRAAGQGQKAALSAIRYLSLRDAGIKY